MVTRPASFQRLMHLSLCFAFAIFASLGCKQSQLVPAQGVVLLNGQPEGKCLVHFEPADGGRTATAITGADGKFTLSTDSTPGTFAGKYKVAVRPTGTVTAEGQANQSASKIPVRYHDTKTSQIEITIESGGSQDLTIQLSTKED